MKVKLEKAKSPGPGAYTTDVADMHNVSVLKKTKAAFGSGDRDVSFAKYSSLNENIYSRGLV